MLLLLLGAFASVDAAPVGYWAPFCLQTPIRTGVCTGIEVREAGSTLQVYQVHTLRSSVGTQGVRHVFKEVRTVLGPFKASWKQGVLSWSTLDTTRSMTLDAVDGTPVLLEGAERFWMESDILK